MFIFNYVPILRLKMMSPENLICSYIRKIKLFVSMKARLIKGRNFNQ